MFTGLHFSASLLILFLTISSASRADNPNKPQGLHVEVYSDTAAELFWDRSMQPGLTLEYEIGFNGSVVAVLDGISYFTNALTKDLAYNATVIAIDDDGRRSEPATVSFIGGDRDQGQGSGPLIPANLRALVYSSSAIELFWDRVTGERLVYEISIDGIVVASSDGTSFFIDELEAGQRYMLSVVAIDSDGNRSAPASIESETKGGPGAPPLGPTAPENVKLVVYSQTAAELFWDRASSEELVRSTEISRDGVVIAAVEGNSFFDDTRAPGVSYIYDLTAIDIHGERSTNTVLIESPTLPIINRDNHIGLVELALPVYFGDSYNTLLVDSLNRLLSSFLGEVFTDDVVTPTSHTCANGGTAYFESSVFVILFTDCQIDDAVFNGLYNIQVGNSNWVSSDDLSIASLSDTTLQFDGSINIAGRYFYIATEVNALLTTPTSYLSLAGVNTLFSFTHRLRCCSGSPNFLARFSGSFDFSTLLTNNEQISVSTLSDFNYSEPKQTHTDDWNYRTGVLRLSAPDNSELLLDADTGDDTTVSIQINNTDGTEEFIQPWSLWQGVLRRIP